ncbi:MAG: DUF2760 domain-containing protein [Gammaproteobacteria bacterium]
MAPLALSVTAIGTAIFTVWKTRSPGRSSARAASNTRHESALQLLGLLQRDARFLDLVYEDIDQHSDRDIGLAARAFLLNCRQVVDTYFDVRPVINGSAGDPVLIKSDFDPSLVRFSDGDPFEPGAEYALDQPGWRATRCRLPDIDPGDNLRILVPAEVKRMTSRPAAGRGPKSLIPG